MLFAGLCREMADQIKTVPNLQDRGVGFSSERFGPAVKPLSTSPEWLKLLCERLHVSLSAVILFPRLSSNGQDWAETVLVPSSQSDGPEFPK